MMNTTRDRTRGFTLIEIVIIVAVMAILAAAITPAVLQQVMDAKVTSTKTSAKALYEAIAGRPDTKGNFGFLGDMGRFPTTLEELIKPAAGTPLFDTRGTFRGVGVGWKGPYISVGETREGFLVDGWGRAFTMAPDGRVHSAGPDGVVGNDDDIVYPPEPTRVGSRVMVTLKRESSVGDGQTVDPIGYEVRLYYAKNGQEAFLASRTPPYTFENVHPGLHAVAVFRLNSNQVVAQDTLEILPNSTKLVEMFFHP